MSITAYLGADIFDGSMRRSGHALLVDGATIRAVVPMDAVPADAEIIPFEGGLVCPGFVDLQVNGGGGIMFNDDQSVGTLRRIADAHAGLGATSILPTLITDTPEATLAAIDAVEAACGMGVPGIAGLHLEGPHLSIARKGAHDPNLIRPMDGADLSVLVAAASRLPVLKITLAPESVSTDQIAALRAAGAVLSLGHSDARFDACRAAASAGVTCVTHLFNAMSQLENREPGLVGAAIALGDLSAGLIADGIHVHPEALRAAYRAKTGPGQMFLVSDAMAVAGSDCTEFALNGRMIKRADGRLTLEDGTLAGADLDMRAALRNMISWGITTQDEALAMVTSIPGNLIGRDLGRLAAGSPADFLYMPTVMAGEMQIWQAGQKRT